MDYMKRLKDKTPATEELALMWMGQAGFVMKNSQGKVLAFDLYLSDLSERLDGNKRLTPAVALPEEIEADVILASHWHTDHLDFDSLPTMLSSDSVKMFCCEQSYQMCEEAGLPMQKITAMNVGDEIDCCGYHVEAVFADHGDTAPKALGFFIQTDGISIYYAADTSYQHERMSYITNRDIDLLIVPINGEYGNMNERDAAMLASQAKANITIPCHFWTFARHQGSPYEFITEMEHVAPDCKHYVMAQGECISYTKTNGGKL